MKNMLLALFLLTVSLHVYAQTFTPNSANVAHAVEYMSRSSADSRVRVVQIGNTNNTQIEQSTVNNNFASVRVTGNNNSTAIKQSMLNPNAVMNYADLLISGSNNVLNVNQSGSSGPRGVFAAVSGDNNTLATVQYGGGHYLEVTLDGNKHVSTTQTGTAGHMASVTLTGQSSSLTLAQTGSSQQWFSINFNCATAGGCGKLVVNQGN